MHQINLLGSSIRFQKLYNIFYSQSPSRLQLKEKKYIHRRSLTLLGSFWGFAVEIGSMSVQRNLKAGIAYFMLVCDTGIALGTVRTLWIVPRIGVRTAELLESPLMLIAIVFAASWTIRLISNSGGPFSRLIVGACLS